MKIYPNILARIGALPFKVLSSIQFPKQEAVQEYIAKKLDSNNKYTEDKQYLIRFEADFENLYQEAVIEPRKAILSLAGKDVLRKGLLQSSHSFVERVEKYQKQAPEEFRKKERQTERSIAQYLARIAAKTSPFSTFTNLSINTLDGKKATEGDGKVRSKVRINNYLHTYLKELLCNFDAFFIGLELKANASVYREGDQQVFLLNSRNIESVQRIEHDEVIEKVFEIIAYYKGKVAFRQLIAELKEMVDAKPEELGLYVLQLQRYGLLEWHWPVSGNDTEWDIKLVEWFKEMKPFTLRATVINSLELLRKNGLDFEEADVPTRKALVLESFESIKDCCARLKSNQWEGLPADKNTFTHFEAGEFIFIPERLYYEDTERSVDINWGQKDLEASIVELDELLHLISPFQIDGMGTKMRNFYADHYKGKDRVGLMQFYSAYFQENEWRLEPDLTQVTALRNEFCEKLSTDIRYTNDFTVDLSLVDLRMITAIKGLEKQPPRSSYSYGALIQFFAKGDTYKSYVDATFTGYGKMLGRFLHLFPTEKTNTLSNWMADMREEQCWVDNVDASIFNANAHPSILPFEISMPGGENRLAPANQIPITDLQIKWDERDQGLVLLKGETEVTVFDLGLEAISNRSPMYQMLTTFGPAQPRIGVLKMLLVSLTRKEENAWYKLPRVNIGEYLVLQRKAWGIPQSELPIRGKTENESTYYLRLNLWRSQYQLPQQLFFTLGPTEFGETDATEGKGDLHKPQFIDFTIPALVSHFARELTKVTGYLKLEEMLPDEDGMLLVGGEAAVSELVVSWAR